MNRETDAGAIAAFTLAIFGLLTAGSGPAVVLIAVGDAKTKDDIVAGVVGGVVGLLALPLLSITLALISERRIRRDDDLSGRGLAGAARTVSLVAIMFVIVTAALFVSAKDDGKNASAATGLPALTNETRQTRSVTWPPCEPGALRAQIPSEQFGLYGDQVSAPRCAAGYAMVAFVGEPCDAEIEGCADTVSALFAATGECAAALGAAASAKPCSGWGPAEIGTSFDAAAHPGMTDAILQRLYGRDRATSSVNLRPRVHEEASFTRAGLEHESSIALLALVPGSVAQAEHLFDLPTSSGSLHRGQ